MVIVLSKLTAYKGVFSGPDRARQAVSAHANVRLRKPNHELTRIDLTRLTPQPQVMRAAAITASGSGLDACVWLRPILCQENKDLRHCSTNVEGLRHRRRSLAFVENGVHLVTLAPRCIHECALVSIRGSRSSEQGSITFAICVDRSANDWYNRRQSFSLSPWEGSSYHAQ